MTAREQSALDFGPGGDRLKKQSIKGGLLITFEGGEGVGKSTQAERLFHKLESLGVDSVLAQEPGGSDLGNNVRRWIKRSNSSSPLAETLLFEAARAQLLHETVRPAIEDGKTVILDRFTDSTLAYQGYARGGDIEVIKSLNAIATGGLLPHLTVLLDADPKIALARVSNRPNLFDSEQNSGPKRVDPEGERRFEQAPLKFHQNIRKGYLELSKGDSRWCVIGANQAGHRIHDAIMKRARRLLVDHGVPEALFKR